MSDCVLLTGATGFLGMEVLHRLLERGEDEVIALVRASDSETAAARVEAIYETLYNQAPDAAARVRAIPGDVASDGLGLRSADRREILARATSVIHCAASITFDLPMEEALNVNTQGARRVAALAGDLSGLRRMVHVSTAYVAGRHRGVFGETDRDVGQTLRNTYEHSKLRAECALADEASELPLAVARPSIVVGDSRSGWTPAFNVIYWPLRAFSRGLLDAVPADPDGIVDIVPIDYVADGILALHDAPEARGAFNLVAGTAALRNHELAELTCREFDRPLPRFDPDTSTLAEAGVYLPYFDVQTTFDDRRARAVLDPPPPLGDYFPALLAYAKAAGWGKRACSREAACAVA